LRSGGRFPQDFPRDGKSASLFSIEVFGNQCAIRAAEIVDVVSRILSHVNLSIWISDLVNDVHRLSGRLKLLKGLASHGLPGK